MSGLYVNTNVNSMIAATNLTKNMGSLSDVLTKLSTGLRINSAKDDPAGLIASEILRSEITASTSALKNTNRAIGMIGMADSALSQVGDLLNDIRGLVNEAANTGAMSDDQINANQLQIDASLDAIDRIAQSTTYMGKKLLDGSMAFQTANLDKSQISNLVINSANFGTQDSAHVQIDVQAASTAASQVFRQAALGSQGATVKVTGNQGSQTFNFGANATTKQMAEQINAVSDSTGVRAVVGDEANAGQVTVTSAGADNDIIFTATTAGEAAGNYAIKYVAGNSDGISYKITEPTADGGCGVIEFQLKMDEWKNAGNSRVDESSLGIYTKSVAASSTANLIFNSTTGSDVQKVNWVFDSNTPVGAPTFVYDKNKSEATITLNDASGTVTIQSVLDAINAQSKSTGLTAYSSVAAAGFVVNAQVSNYTTDLRANNSLDIQALTGDAKYNNTDVVYITDTAALAADPVAKFSYVDQAQRAAVSFQNGTAVPADGKFIEIEATNAGSAYNGYQFKFTQGATNDPLSVSTDETNKIITITGDFVASGTNNNSLADLRDAIQSVKDKDGNSLFTLSVYNTNPATDANAAKINDYTQKLGNASNAFTGAVKTTGQTAGQVGTDHGALIIALNNQSTAGGRTAGPPTAQEVVTAFNTTASEDLKALFSVANAKDSTGAGTLFANVTTVPPNGIVDTSPRVFSGALTGGQNGNITNTTAKELIDFVSKNEELSKLITAQLAPNSQQGNGKLTLFDEMARYGCPYDGTAIQFLGPQGSPNIEFATNGANQTLSISFTPDVLGTSSANLAAYNANAAFSLTANNKGGEYDDAIVRFKRVINATQASTVGNSVTYSSGPSNAMAFGNLGGNLKANPLNSDGSVNTASGFNGTFIFNALGGGDTYNNVTIQATLDQSQTKAVQFSYNADTKTFDISVNSSGISLAAVIDAFQTDPENADLRSKFQFELDYSDTYRDYAGATGAINYATGSHLVANDGSMTFATILASSNTATLGNTGTTGGHTGGVIEVAIYDDLYGVDATGKSTFGDTVTTPTTITGVPDTSISGDMTVTTAATNANVIAVDSKLPAFQANDIIALINNTPEVAKYFTAAKYGTSTGEGNIAFREDTVGPNPDTQIGCGTVNSPRMVTSGGIKEAGKMIVNLATDKYGNSITTAADLVAYMDTLTPEQTRGISASLIYPPGVTPSACDTTGGYGILEPTSYMDTCGEVDDDIVFTSCGSDIRDKKPLSEIVAINGASAGYTLFGKQAGASLEGTTLKYVALTDASVSPYATYSKENNEITVFIRDGSTTAKDVKNIIATSKDTKDLFEVQLRTDGSGVVKVEDNTVSLAGSEYEAGYRGGVSMLWNIDDSSNEMYLESMENGSNQFVQIDVLNGSFDTVDSYTGQTQSRSYGTDIEATANGQKLQANGNNVSLNTTNLSFTATINADAEAGDSYGFDIVSGGALFQLGPDVVSAQQVHLGIPSVMTTDLGGSSGFMSDLRSGGKADLSSDSSRKLADRIVKDAISSVSNTRGRLGAIQKATLESNVVTLENSIEALTSARADIIDTDFAAASAELTKYQILVQSGSRVLAIANQLPQYAASLIG